MACYDTSPYLCTYDSAGAGSLPGGGNPDYSTLSTWESASDNDLSGLGIVVLDCYDSQDHAQSIAMLGATNTDATHYRVVRSSPNCATPWAGKAGTGANFVLTSGSIQNVFRLGEAYPRVENLYISFSTNYGAEIRAIFLDSSSSKAIGCSVTSTNAHASYGAGGIYSDTSSLMYKCIALNCETYGLYSALSSGQAGIICCTAINSVSGFRSASTSGLTLIWSCYGANNSTYDFEDDSSKWTSGSGWNASKDNTSDLNTLAGDNYKNGLDLLTSGDLDSDGLATAFAYADGSSGDKYGRNPYDDATAVSDFDNFFKNDTAGETESKTDISGIARLEPDTADTSWNVGASDIIMTPIFAYHYMYH